MCETETDGQTEAETQGCMDSVEWNGGMEWWNGLEWTGLEWTGMEWNDRSTNFVGVAKLCPRQFQYPALSGLKGSGRL